MRLLLDTHIAVWVAMATEKLNQVERSLMADAEGPFLLSAISLWELRLKWSSLDPSGTPKGPLAPEDMLAFVEAIGWTMLPLTARHAAETLVIPIPHRDPFDEMLLIQAQVEGVRLLTRDGRLLSHPIAIGRR